MACGSTSIRDVASNALDGNIDGVRGGDFVLTYRVERDNLFDNGFFDCEINPWIPESTDPFEIRYNTDDIDLSTVSGSAAITNLTASTDFSLAQCPAVEAGEDYVLAGWVSLAAAPGIQLLVSRTCEFFPEPLCGGAALLTQTETVFLGDTGGLWQPVASLLVAPATAMLALCSFDLQTPAGDDFDSQKKGMSLLSKLFPPLGMVLHEIWTSLDRTQADQILVGLVSPGWPIAYFCFLFNGTQ